MRGKCKPVVLTIYTLVTSVNKLNEVGWHWGVELLSWSKDPCFLELEYWLHVGFEVLTMVDMNVALFWVTAPSSPYMNRRFRRNVGSHTVYTALYPRR
jgi:hypothetical protein